MFKTLANYDYEDGKTRIVCKDEVCEPPVWQWWFLVKEGVAVESVSQNSDSASKWCDWVPLGSEWAGTFGRWIKDAEGSRSTLSDASNEWTKWKQDCCYIQPRQTNTSRWSRFDPWGHSQPLQFTAVCVVRRAAHRKRTTSPTSATNNLYTHDELYPHICYPLTNHTHALFCTALQIFIFFYN